MELRALWRLGCRAWSLGFRACRWRRVWGFLGVWGLGLGWVLEGWVVGSLVWDYGGLRVCAKVGLPVSKNHQLCMSNLHGRDLKLPMNP